jgi:hypothetical protein
MYRITTAVYKRVERNSYTPAPIMTIIPAQAGIHCGTDVLLIQPQPNFGIMYERSTAIWADEED